jgi:hypothetical protein
MLAGSLATADAASATGKDLQAWPLARVQYGIDEAWAVALTARGRWNEDLSRHRDWLLRPYVTWTPVRDVPFVDSLTVFAGYDYLKVNGGRDEHRAWQAIHHTPKRGIFGAVHRARLDERWIDGLDKVIWRLRYRLSATRQLFESPWYGRLSDEVLVNLNDEDKGPVGGFEGNRARLAFGRYFSDRLRFESGYQFEYARRRGRVDEFRHTLFVEISLFTGKVRGYERRKEAPVDETDPGAEAGSTADAAQSAVGRR